MKKQLLKCIVSETPLFLKYLNLALCCGKALFLSLIVCSFTVVSVKSQTTSISTYPTMTASASRNAITFELTNNKHIQIKNFEVGVVGTQTLDVYYRSSGVQHSAGNAPIIDATHNWVLLGSMTFTAPGPGIPSSGAPPLELYLPPGTHGFCFTISSGPFGGIGIKPWTSGSSHIFTNSDVTIDIGPGKGYSGTFPTLGSEDGMFVGGLNYIPYSPQNDDISIFSIDSPAFACPGTRNFSATLRNLGSNRINSVNINWRVNGGSVQTYSYSGLIDTLGGNNSLYSFEKAVTFGTIPLAADQSSDIEVWTSLPNGNSDPNTSNDSLQAFVWPSMTGSYTIDVNGFGPMNFTNFKDAVSALKQRGICGPVTFNVAGGIYNEHIFIDHIMGTSSTNTITFQPDANNTGAVEMMYTSTHDDSNYVVQFNGCSYVTFDGIAMTNNGTSYSNVVVYGEASHHNTIKNCSLYGPVPAPSTSDNLAVIYCENSPGIEHNVIKDNYIYGGSYGIHYMGVSSSERLNGVVISGNTLEEPYRYGMYVYEVDSAKILYNKISSNTTYSGTGYAIYCRYGDYLDVEGNIIQGNPTWPVYGLYYRTCNGSESDRSLIANNLIHCGSPAVTSVFGIFTTDCNNIDVLHNNVVIEGTSVSASAAALTGGGNNNNVYNNNFLNYGNGYALTIDSAGYFSDYNNLVTNGGNLCFFAGGRGAVSNLTTWQATGNGLHSLSVDPLFPHLDSLYTQAAGLDNRGTSLPQVPFDIDGNPRSAAAPDIGANEFSAFGGDCNAFTDYKIDSIAHDLITIDWEPGTGNTSFYVEYGPKGFTPGSGILITGTYPGTQPTLYIDSTITESTEYDIYIGELCNSGADSSYLKGKWTVKTLPACPPLQVISLDYVSSDSAVFSFSYLFGRDLYEITSDFDYEYGPQGFEQGTGTLGTFTNPGGIGSLTPLTYYDIYIRNNCDAEGNGTTNWIGPYTFYTDCPAPMSGPYMVNPSLPLGNRNYKNFQLLVSDLEHCGISGPVTVNVSGGSYNEYIKMGKIPGASASSPILIQADTSENPLVEIEHTAISPDDNYTWKMDSASYVTLRGIHFKVDKNRTFYGGNTSAIEISAGSSNIALEKNRLSGGTYGIYAAGVSSGGSLRNIRIDSNFIEGYSYTGVQASYQDSLIIRGNNVSGNEGIATPSGLVYGMLVEHVKHAELTGNRISLNKSDVPQTHYGLRLLGVEGDTAGNPSVIANNMVSVFNHNGESHGILAEYCDYADLVHNSILLTGSPVKSHGVQIVGTPATGTGMQILNNSVVNNAGGMAIEANAAMIFAMDHNNYFVSGSTLGNWGGSIASDLTAWQNLSGQDAYSVSGDPVYNSAIDLHVSSPLLKGAGVPYSLVDTDYDGDARSATSPDIGADEFELDDCYPSYNLEALAVYHDRADLEWIAGAGSSHNIEYGPVGYVPGSGTQVNGITGTTYTLNGLIPRTTYDIYISDYCSTGDTSIWLGPLTIRIKCTNQLSGTYTIDNGQATGGTNFSSFVEAATDLNECGISRPVTFYVKEGIYNDSLAIENVEGSSDINTITFEPDPSNTSDVTLQKKSESAENNYVVQFDNASYVTIKGLTISALDTNYGRVICFQGRNEHIVIENNALNGAPGSLDNDASAVVFMDGNLLRNDNLNHSIIRNNRIHKGSYGLYLEGTSNSEGNSVEGNTVTDYLSHGINISNLDSLLIKGNIIISGTSNTATGIHSRFMGYGKILDNQIVVKATANNYGIRLEYCNGADGNSCIIANNMVVSALNSLNNVYGLYVESSTYTDIVYNSVMVNSGSQSGSHACYLSGGTDVKLFNNSLVNAGQGVAMQITSSGVAAINEMNYNNLYTLGTNLGSWGGTSVTNILDWKALSGKDANSVSGDPFYKALGNLHFRGTNSIVNGAGTPYPGITTDIDGHLRSATAPDIGADEGPDCELSTGLSIDSISCYNAYLSWTPGLSGAFALVEYDTTGFATGTGHTVFSDSTLFLPGLKAGTTYEVYLSDTCGPDTVAALGPISFTTLQDTTVADFSFTARPATLTDQTVDFDASASTGTHTYQWNFGDGNSGNGMMTSHSYTANGTYSVQLIVTGDCGNDTATQDVVISGISLEENIISRSLEVYPNPTEDRIQIRFDTQSSEEVSIRLSDLSGKMIWENTATDVNGRYEGEISLDHLAKGTYMLQIRSSGMEAVKRIVKQ